jgi:hypothetical protein
MLARAPARVDRSLSNVHTWFIGSSGRHSIGRPITLRGCLQDHPLVLIDLEHRAYMVLSMRLGL